MLSLFLYFFLPFETLISLIRVRERIRLSNRSFLLARLTQVEKCSRILYSFAIASVNLVVSVVPLPNPLNLKGTLNASYL